MIIDKDFPYDIIDHKRVKYIPFGDFYEPEIDIDLEPTNLVFNFIKETDGFDQKEGKSDDSKGDDKPMERDKDENGEENKPG